MLATTSLVLGLPAALLAGTAPDLVPVLLGERWIPSVDALAWGAAALLLYGPISVASSGFLQARGEVGLVVRIVVVQALVWIAVAAVLVSRLGPAAVGIGMLLGAGVYAVLTTIAIRRHVKVRVASMIAKPSAVALVASGTGLLVAAEIRSALAGLMLSGIVVCAVYGGCCWLVARSEVESLLGRLRKAKGR